MDRRTLLTSAAALPLVGCAVAGGAQDCAKVIPDLTNPFWLGDQAGGAWRLCVGDSEPGNTGSLTAVELRFLPQ